MNYMTHHRRITQITQFKIKNDKFELSAYESFMKDIYDPLEFKRNFINVLKPRKDGNGFDKIKFEPYWYQNAWTEDPSMLKYTAKSRQIGFSFNEMIDSLHKAITTPNYLKLFVSLRQEQANELLTIVRNAVRIMDDEWKIPFDSDRDSLLKFENGSRLMALPTKEMAGRSFHGDIFIDEIAFIPNDERVLEGILQGSVREGYKVAIGSTPYGQRGAFHKILKDAGWDTNSEWTNPKDMRTYIRKYDDFIKNNQSEWSIHLIPWWACPDLKFDRIRPRVPTKESFLQEYGIAFLDDTTAMLGYQLMLSRMNENLPQFESHRPYRADSKSRITAGLDPAERRNQTAFVVFERINNIYYKRYREVWTNKSHTIYNPEVIRLMKLWGIHHLYVDETGLGAPVLADLKQYLPSSRLTGVNFSSTNVKLDLVSNLVYLYEAGDDDKDKYQIWTNQDITYFDQLHQLRRERTKTGAQKFTGKIDGKDDDIIWATALALSENIEKRYGSFMARGSDYKDSYRRPSYYENSRRY